MLSCMLPDHRRPSAAHPAAAAPGPAARAALVLAACLVLAPDARADGFSCGSRVVTDGMSADEVRAACGPPARITSKTILRRPVVWWHGRPIRVGDGEVEVTVETWLYNFGPTRLLRQLRFEDGVLHEVETLGYGWVE
jgi:hypothetical protein